ncbi:MAG: hypothetical protein ACM3ZB_02305 [bacterium]|jgi:hypothetical protein
MFEGLDERIKQDEGSTRMEKAVRMAIVLAVSLVIFGGVYLGLQFLE